MNNPELLKAALEYRKLGCSVIPLFNKEPRVKWQQYQLTLPSTTKIKYWFKTIPDITGIGIITGEVSGLVVIDVDPRNGGNFDELEQLHTPTTISGSGGRHFFFSGSDEDDFKTEHFSSAGFDILGNGAYVVAPPSLHPTGQLYQWRHNLANTDLLPFPKSFRDKFSPNSQRDESKKFYPLIRLTKIKYKDGSISDSELQRIRNIPIWQVIEGEGITVPPQTGQYSKILCPFHNDRNPSMAVYYELNFAHCFACNQRFNTIDFIRRHRGIEFREACFYLMEKYGLAID